MPVESEPKTTKDSGEKSFANTVNFLQDASVVPIDWKMQFPTKSQGQSQEKWEKMWDVVGLYAGTDETLDDIGKRYNATRESTRQLFEKGITKLRKESSSSLRSKHPEETMASAKPRSVKSIMRFSQSHGGTLFNIAQELKKGSTPQNIQSKLNISNLSPHRKRLSKLGILLPYQLETYSPEYKRDLEKLRDPQTPNWELHKIMSTFDQSRYQSYSKGDKPYVVSVTQAARLAGLFPNRHIKKISRLLLEGNIPVIRTHRINNKDGHEMIYYFIASGKLTEALSLFRNKQFDKFRQNPITVIGSYNGEIPNTYQIQNRSEFMSLSSLIKEIGLKLPQTRRGRPSLTSYIKADCPVPIFVYLSNGQGSFYTFRLTDKEALKKYLERTAQNR